MPKRTVFLALRGTQMPIDAFYGGLSRALDDGEMSLAQYEAAL